MPYRPDPMRFHRIDNCTHEELRSRAKTLQRAYDRRGEIIEELRDELGNARQELRIQAQGARTPAAEQDRVPAPPDGRSPAG